jgi:hypothetical protein
VAVAVEFGAADGVGVSDVVPEGEGVGDGEASAGVGVGVVVGVGADSGDDVGVGVSLSGGGVAEGVDDADGVGVESATGLVVGVGVGVLEAVVVPVGVGVVPSACTPENAPAVTPAIGLVTSIADSTRTNTTRCRSAGDECDICVYRETGTMPGGAGSPTSVSPKLTPNGPGHRSYPLSRVSYWASTYLATKLFPHQISSCFRTIVGQRRAAVLLLVHAQIWSVD